MGTQAPSGPTAASGPEARPASAAIPGPSAPGPVVVPPPVEADLPSPRRALELVGLVVAPTTLVTALAFYFGWVLTNSRASYFGIDASALGYSTQDYLLRSADALFVPLGSVFALALGGVWLHAYAIGHLGEAHTRDRLRLAARTAAGVGAALFALGAFAVFKPLSFSPHYLFPSASPGIGIALLAYGLHLLDRIAAVQSGPARPAPSAVPSIRATALTLVALLVVLSGFWTASRYADALGRGRAERLAVSLTLRPQVTVFAPKRLALQSGGVVERRLADGGAYGYSYSGLRLLIRSGGKYFLLPDGWTRGRDSAIVLADSPDYRFEFGAGR